jgi:hypothetical protein
VSVKRSIEERLWTWVEVWDKRGTYTRGGLYDTRAEAKQAHHAHWSGGSVQFVRVTLTYEMKNVV